MSGGELFLFVLLNLAVGIYFAVIYPRSLKKRFTAHTMPRAFVLLLKVVPPVGYLIIGLTLFYAAAELLGWVQ
jgi:hypothetical protein